MALPLQELIPPPQAETPTAQEDTSPQNETSLPQQEGTSLSKEETSPPKEETLWRQHHAPIVSVAAKALTEKNIPIVEYGEQIQWRYGDPVLLLRVEWAVPDELLSLASEILSDQGFPPVSMTTGAATEYGE